MAGILLVLAAVLGVTQWGLPILFRKSAEEYAQELVREAGLESFSFTNTGTLQSTESFAEEVFRLAAWEEEEKERIREVLIEEAMLTI